LKIYPTTGSVLHAAFLKKIFLKFNNHIDILFYTHKFKGKTNGISKRYTNRTKLA
jgi:hypothetical protein